MTFIRPREISFSATFSSSLSATRRFREVFSRSSSRNRLASSAFIPPYWLRQRWKVTSETSRALATSAIDLPSPSISSAARSLRMTWLGVWRFAFTLGSSLPILVGGKNSQTGRTDFRGSVHRTFVPVADALIWARMEDVLKRW